MNFKKQLFISFMLTIAGMQSMLAMDPVAPEPQAPSPEIRKLNADLIDAIFYGSLRSITNILTAGAQVDAREPNRGNTALMCAAWRGRYDLCQILIDHGAQVNAKNHRQITALMMAALLGNDEICDLLLQRKAEVNAQGYEDITALMMAAGKNHGSTCKLLIEHGAQLEAKKHGGFTALHHAAYPRNNWAQFFRNMDTALSKQFNPNEEIWACKTLLEHGAQINARCNNGFTALMLAAGRENVPVCKILVTQPLLCPSVSRNELQISRNRIFTALCAFKRTCPLLPKAVRYHILWNYLQEDVSNSAFGIHKNQHRRTLLLPLATIRLLITNDILDTEKTVTAIKAHHIACIKPLMIEALPYAQTDKIRALLNPYHIEENFGADIELTIKNRLGIPSAWTNFAQKSACNVQ